MYVNPNSIEALAVLKIINIAMQPQTTLLANIPIGDKGVSFDGHIEVYEDEFKKKNHYWAGFLFKLKEKP